MNEISDMEIIRIKNPYKKKKEPKTKVVENPVEPQVQEPFEMEIIRGVKNPYKKKKEPKVKEPKYPIQQKAFDIDAIKKNIIQYTGKSNVNVDEYTFHKAAELYRDFFDYNRDYYDVILTYRLNPSIKKEYRDAYEIFKTYESLALDRIEYVNRETPDFYFDEDELVDVGRDLKPEDIYLLYGVKKFTNRYFEFEYKMDKNYKEKIQKRKDNAYKMYMKIMKLLDVSEQQAKDVASKRYKNKFGKDL
jgi:hypothetical protein